MYVEKVFRGKRYPDCWLTRASYKSDYRLIPKDEEAAFCKLAEEKQRPESEKIFPRTMAFPPLMRELILREARANGEEIKGEPQMEVKYSTGVNSHVRVAKDGETPNVELHNDLGVPASPSLYKGINLERNP